MSQKKWDNVKCPICNEGILNINTNEDCHLFYPKDYTDLSKGRYNIGHPVNVYICSNCGYIALQKK